MSPVSVQSRYTGQGVSLHSKSRNHKQTNMQMKQEVFYPPHKPFPVSCCALVNLAINTSLMLILERPNSNPILEIHSTRSGQTLQQVYVRIKICLESGALQEFLDKKQ